MLVATCISYRDKCIISRYRQFNELFRVRIQSRKIENGRSRDHVVGIWSVLVKNSGSRISKGIKRFLGIRPAYDLEAWESGVIVSLAAPQIFSIGVDYPQSVTRYRGIRSCPGVSILEVNPGAVMRPDRRAMLCRIAIVSIRRMNQYPDFFPSNHIGVAKSLGLPDIIIAGVFEILIAPCGRRIAGHSGNCFVEILSRHASPNQRGRGRCHFFHFFSRVSRVE